MALSNVLEKLGRAVFESPFGANRLAKDAPELAEIRLAALDAIKARSHRLSGKNVFPHDLIRIELLGIPEEQQAVFQSEFLTNYFVEELRRALTRSSYRFPTDLAVEFHTSSRLPHKGESWYSVESSMRPRTIESPAAQTALTAALTVLNGSANQMKLALKKVRTNIGRTAEVFKTAGPSRRNDLVFLDEDETGKTVSREHAHIVRSSAKGEYRLFNDRSYRGESNCALWIVRDGLSHPVHRNSRGTLLQLGDEIHVGTAVIRFSLEKR
jgi:pSer/pThr/pTyr-binding forkhead associated (FHA) protein